MIEVELPDGSIAEFPDGTSTDVIKSALQKRFAKPQSVAPGKSPREMTWGDTAMDAAKSLGSGVVQGAVGLATMPQDLGQWLGEKATGALDRYVMGKDDAQIAAEQQAMKATRNASPLAPPSYGDAVGAVESVTGPMYQPQTTAGEYANTIGQFAAGAAAGPGGLARKAAMTVVPGAASEGAGQLAQEYAPELESYARVGGALAGGVASAGRGNTGTRQMLKNVGKSEKAYADVSARTNRLYDTLRKAGVKYDANNIQKSISDAAKLKIDPVLDPNATRLRDVFAQNAGKSLDFEELDNLKQMGTSILRNGNVAERDKFFVRALLDQFTKVSDGAFITNGSVPASQIKPLVQKAKELARSKIIARDIGKMKDKAEWYVSGPESGLRNQFASYGKKNQNNLTPMEEKAFKSVTTREGVLNPLHNAGSRLGQLAIGGLGYGAGGPLYAIASVIGSSAARKFMEVYTARGVEEALRTVLAGKSAQQKAAVIDALAKGDARVRALLATESGRRSSEQAGATGTGAPFLPQ